MHGMKRARTIAGPREGARRREGRGRLALALALLALAGAAGAQETPIPGEFPPHVARRAAAAVAREPAAPPDELRDVAEWIRWKHSRQITSLPMEARIFYRRGLLAERSGQRVEALADVRGAIELDPTLVQPHLTLAAWLAFSDPAQALVHLAAVFERLRRDFNLQLDLAANAFTLGVEALFAGLLFAGLIVVFLRRDELAHGFEEQLAQHASRASARWWVPVLLTTPFMAGLGLTLPVLLMLGFLWPVLRARERALHVTLTLAAFLLPLAPAAMDRFALALRPEGRPFHELPALEHAVWTAERQERLEREAARNERDGFAQFALAWHSRRGGDLARAEQAYEAALRAWPDHPAVLVDLGNVVAMRGHTDRALDLYRRAAARDPSSAAAHFNAAQLLTRRFEYTAANEELRQASALDFDLVHRYQSRAGASGRLPLVDVWPGPRTFWTAIADGVRGAPHSLPLLLRGRIEASGWGFSFGALMAAVAGHLLGGWRHRRLPLRHCSNCGAVVCRRCARRRRETALCEECDRIGSGAETQDFSRVLLLQHLARLRDVRRVIGTVLAALLPGYGLLSHQRVFVPVLLLSLTWLLGRLASGLPLPFAVTARLAMPGTGVPPFLIAAGLVFVYAWSLLGFLAVAALERRLDAAARSAAREKISQGSRRPSTQAA